MRLIVSFEENVEFLSTLAENPLQKVNQAAARFSRR